MAFDDRERNFEKALGRELRAGNASRLDCPDTETLAAYHERMLSPEEMAAQKSHIAACPHCQQLLTTLEVTEAVSSVAEDSEKLVEQQKAPVPASAKRAEVREIEIPKRKIALRWAVPAGAIAAGLLVWIAINTSRSPKQMNATAPIQVAENRESRDSQLVAPKQQSTEMKRQRVQAPTLADQETNNSKAEFDELRTADSAGAIAKEKKNVTRGYEHGPRAMQNQIQNQVQNQIQNNGRFSADDKILEEKRLDGTFQAGAGTGQLAQNAPRQEAQARKAAVPAAPPAPATAPSVVGGAAGAGVKTEQNKDAAVGAVSQTVTVESQSAYAANEQKVDADKNAAFLKLKGQMAAGLPVAANLRDAKAGMPGFVGTPDPQVFWFFTTNGIVFRTEDGGQTKKVQKTESGLKFVAGSAPDKKTCWLLAEDGKVARTTNAGKSWTTTETPSNQIFTMITAVDAKNALITDTAARVSYSTSNGGTTWKVVPQP